MQTCYTVTALTSFQVLKDGLLQIDGIPTSQWFTLEKQTKLTTGTSNMANTFNYAQNVWEETLSMHQ